LALETLRIRLSRSQGVIWRAHKYWNIDERRTGRTKLSLDGIKMVAEILFLGSCGLKAFCEEGLGIYA